MLWLSGHVTRDGPHSPDGRLSALAIDFARQILEGTLHPRDAAGWITWNVCE